VSPFVQICHWLHKSGLSVPKIVIEDKSQGFLLLQDFGDTTWSVHLKENNGIDDLFKDALHQLHMLQKADGSIDLPSFDMQRMTSEIDLYLDWYLPHIKSHTPTTDEREKFHQALIPVLKEIDNMPKAPVHLDYHSRNLMVPDSGLPLGVIDFQDAVVGPITYDLASLLYDCYQDYPETERRKWSKHFFDHLGHNEQSYFNDFEAWHRALRLTSLQRHIKVLGIFARLAHRDGKSQFLAEIPLTHKHCMEELTALNLEIPLLNA